MFKTIINKLKQKKLNAIIITNNIDTIMIINQVIGNIKQQAKRNDPNFINHLLNNHLVISNN